MAKARIELPNGTQVTVEGTPEEVKKLLEFYGGPTAVQSSPTRKRKTSAKSKKKEASARAAKDSSEKVNLEEIIDLIKNCDDAEDIESNILDRVSQIPRVLLPLYIVHEHLSNAYGLTSGIISKITTDLGIPIQAPNASRVLSGTASRYVVGDKVRKKGQPTRYKLTRRGVKYLASVIQGTEHGE